MVVHARLAEIARSSSTYYNVKLIQCAVLFTSCYCIVSRYGEKSPLTGISKGASLEYSYNEAKALFEGSQLCKDSVK
jgi:hypothetical protein